MTVLPTFDDITSQLGFVLAIDGCARNCAHCSAFGSTAPVQRADIDTLTRRLASIAHARAHLELPAAPDRTVHSWRISDPLDYRSRTSRDGTATAADVAVLWHEQLHQGLYVVTNGSEGRQHARRALAAFAATPLLISQLKLTITPADQDWGTDRYIDDLAADLRLVLPLWELPADRPENQPGALRLRINLKTTANDHRDAREITAKILRTAGLSAQAADTALDDPQRVACKAIYDLGRADGGPSAVPDAVAITDTTGQRNKPTPETRARIQYGIRPDGRLFVADMYAFAEADLMDPTTHQPTYWHTYLATTSAAPMGNHR